MIYIHKYDLNDTIYTYNEHEDSEIEGDSIEEERVFLIMQSININKLGITYSCRFNGGAICEFDEYGINSHQKDMFEKGQTETKFGLGEIVHYSRSAHPKAKHDEHLEVIGIKLSTNGQEYMCLWPTGHITKLCEENLRGDSSYNQITGKYTKSLHSADNNTNGTL